LQEKNTSPSAIWAALSSSSRRSSSRTPQFSLALVRHALQSDI